VALDGFSAIAAALEAADLSSMARMRAYHAHHMLTH
jgi:hypothetical protein